MRQDKGRLMIGKGWCCREREGDNMNHSLTNVVPILQLINIISLLRAKFHLNNDINLLLLIILLHLTKACETSTQLCFCSSYSYSVVDFVILVNIFVSELSKSLNWVTPHNIFQNWVLVVWPMHTSKSVCLSLYLLMFLAEESFQRPVSMRIYQKLLIKYSS